MAWHLQDSDQGALCWVEGTILAIDPKQIPNSVVALLHVGINSIHIFFHFSL